MSGIGNGKDFLQCGTCQMVFADIPQFQEHKKGCSLSGREGGFDNSEELTQYVEVNVLPSTRSSQAVALPSNLPGDLKCKVCQKTYGSLSSLKAHVRLHNAEKPYVCPHSQCGASFKIKSSLDRHNLRHLDLRPFSCDLCGRSFRESGSLSRHKRSIKPCNEKLDTSIPMYGKRLPYSGEINKDSLEDPITVQTLNNSDMQIISELSKPLVDFITISAGTPEGMDSQSQSSTGSAVTSEKNVENHGKLDHNIDDMAKPHISEPYPMLNFNIITSAASEKRVNPYSTCLICTDTFDKKMDLHSHLLRHMQNNSFLCDKCPFQGLSKKELKMHVSHDHTMPEHAGRIMSHMTPISRSANEPRDAVDSNPTTSDEEIELSAAETDSNLQQVPENSTACNPNLKQAIRDSSRAVQQLLLIDSDVPPHLRPVKNCPICQKSFTANGYLQTHLRSHTGERPYRCKQCGKDFTTMDTFRKHIIIHGSERQYKCGECGKLFKRITHVKEHLKIHNQERPYTCNLCQKSFRTRSAWKVHLRTHSDYLPWQCKVCKKGFREKAGLIRHIRIHTGERPFSCKYCGKRFREHSTINRHLQAKVPCRIELAEARLQGIPLIYSVLSANQPAAISNQAIITEEEYIVHTNNDEPIIETDSVPLIGVYNADHEGRGVYHDQIIDAVDTDDEQPSVVLGNENNSDTRTEMVADDIIVDRISVIDEDNLHGVEDNTVHHNVISASHRDETTIIEGSCVPTEVYVVTEEADLQLHGSDQWRIGLPSDQ